MTFVELGSVANVSWGDTSTTKKSYVDSGYQAFSATGPDGFLPEFDFDQSGLVLSAIGARCGRCFKAVGRWKAIKNTITITTPRESKLDINYLYYIANNEDFWPKRGMAQPFIGLGDARKVKIPLPPIAEQKRIAAILDAADALRAKRRETLDQFDTLLQSTFLDMFGEPVSNPRGWALRPLDELGQVQTGSTPPSKLDGMFDGDIPFVTPGDLKGSWTNSSRTVTKAGAEKSRTVARGATFVCCIGTIGKMGKAEELSAFNQQINAVTWGSRIDDNFGFEMMKFFKEKISKDGASTTLPILKKSLFEKIIVPAPPLPLQRRFAAIVESVEQQKTRLCAHLTELDTLFASLQHRAFNGEL